MRVVSFLISGKLVAIAVIDEKNTSLEHTR
jgi:hypothetical protein